MRALLDFGASGARAALVTVDPHGIEVLGYGAAAGDGRAVRPEHLASLAESALSAAEAETTRYQVLPTIADVAVVGLSGPLLAAEPIVLRLPRNDPDATLHRDELEVAFERAQRQGTERIRAREATQKVPYQIVDTELVGVVIDVNTVDSLPGPSGSSLAVATCSLAWPEAQLDLLESVVVALDLELTGVVSTLRAVARAAPLADAVLLDVGSSHTGIGLMEDQRLSHAGAIARGGAHFTQSLCTVLGVSEHAAEIAKHRYALGHGSAPGRDQVARALSVGIDDWLEALCEALADVAGQAPLPAHVFLFGGGSRIPDLLPALRNYNWPTSLFGRQPAVESLYPHHLRGVSDPNGALHTLDQVGIAAMAAWVAREPNELEVMFAVDT